MVVLYEIIYRDILKIIFTFGTELYALLNLVSARLVEAENLD